MADVKHTPGPWFIREWPAPFVTIVSEFPPASDPRDASGTEICRVINPGNACLMAAAPDLLEALIAAQTVLRYLPDMTTNWGGERETMSTRQAEARVIAAIAKATGAARATEGSV